MKASNLRRISTRLLNNIYGQASLIGLVTILPFVLYIIATNSIIAPLNIIPGWDMSAAGDAVIAKTPSDVNQQMLPFREYTKDALVNYHEIPLWNNRSFAGDVFLANPINTVLSPFNLLLYFMDIFTFQNIIVLFGFFSMSASTFLLIRQLGLSINASVIGAVAYSYAPFSIFWSIYGVVSVPMAAIPLVLYLYLKWKQQTRPVNRYLPLISLTLGLTVYTGHVQIVMLSYIILVLAVCYDLLFIKLGIKKAVYAAAAVIVAIIIGAAQIVPMVTQTPLSHRSQEIESTEPRPWLERFTEIIKIPNSYPLATGPDELGLSTRRELSTGQIPGILLIISLVALMVMAKRREVGSNVFFYLFLFLFGASWQWSDFPQTMLNAFSPTFRSLATDYFLPIALLGMAVLAAYGLDWLLNALFKKARIRRITPRFAVFFLPVLGVVLLSAPQLMLSRVASLDTTYYTIYYVAIILTLLFYIIRKDDHFAKILFGVTLVAVALLQGWSLYRVSQPIVPREIVTIKSQQLNYITSKNSRMPTIVDYSGPQESAFYNISLINGYDSLYSSSILQRIRAINYPNITPPTYRNNALVINTTEKSTLFKNLGVTYTMNNHPSSGYNAVAEGVYAADQPTPQVYFAKNINIQSKYSQLRTIQSGAIDYHEVLIDKSYPIADPSSTVSYRRTPNTLTLETFSPNGGLVFIAQTYNKDWRVSLDKTAELDILPAYYDLSAINVPSGRHTIRLEYKPTAVLISLGFSVIVTLLVLAVLAYTVRKEYLHI